MLSIHPHALKHGLTQSDIEQAFENSLYFFKRNSNDYPERWICLGLLGNGETVELVLVELPDSWLVIHAMSPATKKFVDELMRVVRGN